MKKRRWLSLFLGVITSLTTTLIIVSPANAVAVYGTVLGTSQFQYSASAEATPTGYTRITALDGVDDSSAAITPTFSIKYNNVSYSTIYVGTNSYITFGTSPGSTIPNSINSVPYPSVMICAGDRRTKAVYYKDDGSTLTIRYEGWKYYGDGTAVAITQIWEATFHKNSNTFEISSGINGGCTQGNSWTGLTDGTSTPIGYFISSVADNIASSTGTTYRFTTGSGATVSTFAPTSTLTNSGSLTYNLTFATAVTGLTYTDFSLTGTGSSTCGTPTVTGSGTNYQIALSGCSPGTVILTLAQNAVADSGSNLGPSTATAAPTVTIDQTPPTVSSVTSVLANGTYGPGTALTFNALMSESVTVSGTPYIGLTIGSTTRYAYYDSTTSTALNLRFKYTIANSLFDIDTDGVTVATPLNLNGGAIKDLALNIETNTAFTAPNTTGILISQLPAAPTVTSYSATNSSISVYFNAGLANGAAISGYKYSTDGGTTWAVRTDSATSTLSPLVITKLSSNTATALTSGASYSIKIRATNAIGDGDSSTATSVSASQLVLTSGTSATLQTTTGKGLSKTISASGGNGTKTLSLAPPASGITFDTTTGILLVDSSTIATTYYETVSATDALSATATYPMTIIVNPSIQLAATTNSLQTTAGVAAVDTITATGGTGNKIFTVTSPATGSGITFDTSTANQILLKVSASASPGTYLETITATDSVTATTYTLVYVTVNSGVTLTGSTALSSTQGTAFKSSAYTASGGSGTLLLSLVTPPSGITLDTSTAATGYINVATSVTSGSYALTMKAIDPYGAFATFAETLTVAAPITLTPFKTSLSLTTGIAAVDTITVAGGTGTKSLSITSSANNGGISLVGSVLQISSGATAGTFIETITATDTVSATNFTVITLTIASPISITGPTSIGTTYGYAFTSGAVVASNGTGTKKLTISSSPTNSGITLDTSTANQALVKVAASVSAGAYSLTLTATDSNSATATYPIALTVNAPITISDTPTVTKVYGDHSVTRYLANGGTAPVQMSVSFSPVTGISWDTSTAGSAALSLDTSVPVGNYFETITASDAVASVKTYVLQITITKATPTLSLALTGGSTSTKYGFPVDINATTNGVGTISYTENTAAISGCTSLSTLRCSWSPRTVGSNRSLVATLLPSDSANYNSVTSSPLLINVTVADTLTIIAQSPDAFTYSPSGISVTNSYTAPALAPVDSLGTIAYSYSGNGYGPSSSAPTNAGSYSITPSISNWSSGAASNYAAIVYTPGTLTINRAANSSTFSYRNGNNLKYAASAVETPTATTRLGDGSISFTASAASAAVCSINSTTGYLALLSAGQCVVTMSVGQGTNYLADTVTLTLAIAKGQRALTLTSQYATAKYGSSNSLTPTINYEANLGSITYSTGSSTACSVSGAGVVSTTLSSGTCSITANLSTGVNYDTATATINFSVTVADSITVTVNALAPLTYTSYQAAVTPSSTVTGLVLSDTAGPVNYLYSSASYVSSSALPIDADTYTVTPAGFYLSYGDINNYAGVVYISNTLVINKAAQSTLTILNSYSESGQNFFPYVTGGNGDGGLTYAVVSNGTATGCTVIGSSIAAATSGSCVITATKATSKNYLAATSAPTTINIVVYLPDPTSFVPPATPANPSPVITLGGSTTVTLQAATLGFTSTDITIGMVGSQVIITGTGFTSDCTVVFGGRALATTVSVDSATQITVTVPASALTGRITIRRGGEMVVSPSVFTVGSNNNNI